MPDDTTRVADRGGAAGPGRDPARHGSGAAGPRAPGLRRAPAGGGARPHRAAPLAARLLAQAAPGEPASPRRSHGRLSPRPAQPAPVDGDAPGPARSRGGRARRGRRTVSVGPDLRISGAAGDPRSESDIRIDLLPPARVIAASNDIGGTRQAQFWSADGGATWSQTSLPLVFADNTQSDPTVGWTSDGSAWAVAIGLEGALFRLRAYRSTDGGAPWTFDDTVSGSDTSADKELM